MRIFCGRSANLVYIQNVCCPAAFKNGINAFGIDFGRAISYNRDMKNTSLKDQSQSKRVGYGVLLALILLVALGCAALSMALLVYFGASVDAFSSAMVALVIFGLALLMAAFCVALANVAKKLIQRFLLVPNDNEHIANTYRTKKDISSIFSLSNIALAIMALGAVFIIISAALGCTDRANWVKVTGPYRDAHGYNQNGTLKSDLKYTVAKDGGGMYMGADFFLTEDAPLKIKLNLRTKRVLIDFDKDNDPGYISLEFYTNYKDQIAVSPKKSQNVLLLTEAPKPEREDSTAELMLGLSDILHSNLSERTIVIHLNEIYRGLVTVEGGKYDMN